MKRIINCIICVTAVIFALSVGSCVSDEPGGEKVDYGKLRIGKMNLTGAKSLALKTDRNSRTIDGEYLSAGLYKIDVNGNISAVGVYFTTDTIGNRLDKEYALRIAPRKIFKLTDGYILATDCEYFDQDGDVVADKWIPEGEGEDSDVKLVRQEVPYKNLLVRLSDGKIWCIDNIMNIIANRDYHSNYFESLKGVFNESTDGKLYFCDGDVYRFNLGGDEASFETITKNVSINRDNYHIDENSIVCSIRDSDGMTFAWPFSGHQTIRGIFESVFDSETKIYEDREDTYFLNRRSVNQKYFWIRNTPYVLVNSSFAITRDKNGKRTEISDIPTHVKEVADEVINNDGIARFCKISYGNSAGSASVSDFQIPLKGLPESASSNAQTVGYKGYKIATVIQFDDYILTSDEKYHSWLTIIDLRKNEWRWLKQVDFKVVFNERVEYVTGNKADTEIFDNRFWNITDYHDPDWGAHWFDLSTFETGFVKFKGSLPSYIPNYDPEFSDGFLCYYGVNPSTGDTDYFYVDIRTGDIRHEVESPTMIFETLINLN